MSARAGTTASRGGGWGKVAGGRHPQLARLTMSRVRPLRMAFAQRVIWGNLAEMGRKKTRRGYAACAESFVMRLFGKEGKKDS